MSDATQKLLNTIFSCELSGKVITVIAPSGLGKTTFTCMQLPAFLFAQLKQQEKLDEKSKFVIVNTDNSLLNERFLQVLKQHGVKYSEFRKYLSVVGINSFHEQDSFVKTVVKQSLESQEIKPEYICVDPFNHTLRVAFAKEKEEYRLNLVGRLSPRLEYQLSLLNMLSRKTNCTVVLTLLPKKMFTNIVPQKWQNAYFGPLEISHLSDIVLWLSHGVHDGKGVTVHLKKHRLKESEQSFNCKITERGLELA